jgi:hypothetical protein
MALSKRNLIKRSKSFLKRRSVKVTMTIVDLSSVMPIHRGKHRGISPTLNLKYQIHPVEPRGPGIGRLFNWS